VRALLCKAFGPPESLVLEEVEEPELGPGQVRIAIKACGINFPDLLIISGKYQLRPPMPFSPGAEVAGEVVEVADDVVDFAPGQRVAAVSMFGGMAEQLCVDAGAVVAVPDGVDDVTAAAFLLTYGTAYHALRQRADLQAGETLLVHAASGGVGSAAVQIGKALGARVIATVGGAEKAKIARELGADEVIDYRVDDFVARVKEVTGGSGADVIYDPVGGDVFDRSLKCIAWNGRLIVVGFASGRIPEVKANRILLKNIAVTGVHWGAYLINEPERVPETFEGIFALYREGKIKPLIFNTYPLEDLPSALGELASRKTHGKLIITP